MKFAFQNPISCKSFDQANLYHVTSITGTWSPLVRAYKVDDSLFYPMKGASKLLKILVTILKSLKVPITLTQLLTWLYSESISVCVSLFIVVVVCFFPSAYHFAGFGVIRKPWEVKKRPTREESARFTGPLLK